MTKCKNQLWDILVQSKPDEVIEIKESLYVDDVLSGGSTVDEVHSLKESAIEIFDRAHFQLHKWHSNEKSLEEPIENDLSLNKALPNSN